MPSAPFPFPVLDVVGLHRGKFPAVLCPLPLQTGLQVLYALLAGGYLVLKAAVVRLQLLDFPLPKREPTFAMMAVFASTLTASSFAC